MNRLSDSNNPRRETDLRPNHPDLPGVMPAMPESPIPDWGQRNRTPDPTLRPMPAQPLKG